MVVVLNRAFMKSVEAILSILFLTAFFGYALQNVYSGTEKIQGSPTQTITDLITALDKSGIIQPLLSDYDARGIDANLFYTVPFGYQYGYDTVITYTSVFKLRNDLSTERTINASFTYNFPEYVDKNSVRVNDNNQNDLVNVTWNWVETRFDITPSSDYTNTNLLIDNIALRSLDGSPINETSLFAVFNDAPVRINISSWTADAQGDNVTADLAFNIPKLNSGEVSSLHLYYAKNYTFYVANYYNVTTTSTTSYVNTTITPSSRADVIISTSLNPDEELTKYLTYSIGSSQDNNYASITGLSTDYSINYFPSQNTTKYGTQPVSRTTPSNYYGITTDYALLNDTYAELLTRVWTKW